MSGSNYLGRYYLATIDTSTVCHVVVLISSDVVGASLSNNDRHDHMSGSTIPKGTNLFERNIQSVSSE